MCENLRELNVTTKKRSASLVAATEPISCGEKFKAGHEQQASDLSQMELCKRAATAAVDRSAMNGGGQLDSVEGAGRSSPQQPVSEAAAACLDMGPHSKDLKDIELELQSHLRATKVGTMFVAMTAL